MEGLNVDTDTIPVLDKFVNDVKLIFNAHGIAESHNLDQTSDYIKDNKHNPITATYYLLLKKQEKDTGVDEFF